MSEYCTKVYNASDFKDVKVYDVNNRLKEGVSYITYKHRMDALSDFVNLTMIDRLVRPAFGSVFTLDLKPFPNLTLSVFVFDETDNTTGLRVEGMYHRKDDPVVAEFIKTGYTGIYPSRELGKIYGYLEPINADDELVKIERSTWRMMNANLMLIEWHCQGHTLWNEVILDADYTARDRIKQRKTFINSQLNGSGFSVDVKILTPPSSRCEFLTGLVWGLVIFYSLIYIYARLRSN